jgi:hypothetical protein
MQMTRILYLVFTLTLMVLNAAALWALYGGPVGVNRIVPAALIINALAWPLALAITYRIGQVTGVEYLHSVRARAAAKKAARASRKSVG